MTLMILAHPHVGQSVANKTISELLQGSVVDWEVRHIHQLYANYQIDVAAEQAALLRHDLIILQYPLYWFNMPAILKIWFDEVFTYQFAYGSLGNKLKNKKLMVSLTVGQPEENFKRVNDTLMDDFLRCVEKSAEYAQMNYLEPVILYDVSSVSGHTVEEIREKANIHAKKIKALLEDKLLDK